jgi:threonine dehydrogenase-like Zn-dependent dehydrogenase
VSDAPSFPSVPDVPAWSFGVARAGEPAFFPIDDPEVGDGGFRVETVCSGLSAGTELSYLKGTNPYLTSSFDPELRVFVPGEAATPYPVTSMGYMEVGRVVDSRTPGLEQGRLLAMRYGHANRHTGTADTYRIPLPDDLDPVLGTYVAHMGPICANGVLHAAAEARGREVEGLADGVRDQHVLVVGGGVVGLLTGLFARHHGAAEVAVADPTPERLAAAEILGLTPVEVAPGPGAGDATGAGGTGAGGVAAQAWRWCKEQWVHGAGDRGADVVFQCRGNSGSLAEALRALRPQGVVIDLAFYQGGADDLRLGEEFHHNGLAVRCAQISRVPRGLDDRWDRARLSHETLALLTTHGNLVRKALVTDVVPIADAPAVVTDLAARRRHALQIVFAFAL